MDEEDGPGNRAEEEDAWLMVVTLMVAGEKHRCSLNSHCLMSHWHWLLLWRGFVSAGRVGAGGAISTLPVVFGGIR